MEDDGSIIETCTCGEIVSHTIISKITVAKLSKPTYTYNGKTKSPSVILKDSQGTVLRKDIDYTMTTPKGRKNVGKYTYTITFKGNYTGTKKLTLTILPMATSLTKVTKGKKAISVKWKKVSKQVTGYEVMYSTSKSFKKGKATKTKLVKKAKITSLKITKLTSKKTYYVKVRTYKTVKINGKITKVYSGWSKPKNLKTL